MAARITGTEYSFTAHAKDIFHESVDQDALDAKLRDAAAVTETFVGESPSEHPPVPERAPQPFTEAFASTPADDATVTPSIVPSMSPT